MVAGEGEVASEELRIDPKRNAARWCVIVMIALTLAVNIPMFVCNTVFGDDWAWVWVHHWQGAGAIQRYMWMIAHPGYGPFLNLYFWLDGDVPGRAARILAVLFHLGNGWMLWRIFRQERGATAIAASIAVLYLSSPFLGGNRATISHAFYDIFIFFYLLSIWLSGRRGLPAAIAAIVCLAIGLSIETLAALEVIRWWHLKQQGASVKEIAWRSVPYLVVILALLISRLTWLVPAGYAAGHNEIEPFSIHGFLVQMWAHLQYYRSALEPTHYVASLFTHENLFIVAALVILSAAIGFASFRAGNGPDARSLLGYFVLGVAVLVLGMLPYVAAHRPPDWTGFYARLAVVSQMGVFILAATSFEIFRGAAARGIIIAVVVFVFSGMELQFGKWMIYDELVVRDLQTALATEFAHHDRELLFVHFRPKSNDLLFVKRCLANYDINVALDITNREHGSFAYDADCDAASYTAEGQCGVTGFDQTPCPPKWDADFVIAPDKRPFTQFRIADLIRTALANRPLDAGTLIVNRGSGPIHVGPAS